MSPSHSSGEQLKYLAKHLQSILKDVSQHPQKHAAAKQLLVFSKKLSILNQIETEHKVLTDRINISKDVINKIYDFIRTSEKEQAFAGKVKLVLHGGWVSDMEKNLSHKEAKITSVRNEIADASEICRAMTLLGLLHEPALLHGLPERFRSPCGCSEVAQKQPYQPRSEETRILYQAVLARGSDANIWEIADWLDSNVPDAVNLLTGEEPGKRAILSSQLKKDARLKRRFEKNLSKMRAQFRKNR